MSDGHVDEHIRKMLEQRCCSRHTRTAEFSRKAPTDWRPQTVRNPSAPDQYFTEDSAWEFIAQALRDDAPIEIVTLERPPGKTGYVLLLRGYPPCGTIYVKLQLAASNVMGRSFHESYVVKHMEVLKNAKLERD